MSKCSSCNASNGVDDKFCGTCGAKQTPKSPPAGPKAKFCARCGTASSGGAFCGKCGHSLHGESSSPAVPVIHVNNKPLASSSPASSIAASDSHYSMLPLAPKPSVTSHNGNAAPSVTSERAPATTNAGKCLLNVGCDAGISSSSSCAATRSQPVRAATVKELPPLPDAKSKQLLHAESLPTVLLNNAATTAAPTSSVPPSSGSGVRQWRQRADAHGTASKRNSTTGVASVLTSGSESTTVSGSARATTTAYQPMPSNPSAATTTTSSSTTTVAAATTTTSTDDVSADKAKAKGGLLSRLFHMAASGGGGGDGDSSRSGDSDEDTRRTWFKRHSQDSGREQVETR
jgi:hypothetical protein